MRFVCACCVALSMFAAVPARATEIDFSAVLTDQEDAPLKDGDKVLTLGRAAFVALVAPAADEQNLPQDEKFRRGDLGLRVSRGGKIDLSVEDIALIKKQIGKTYGPLVVVRAFPLLDPKK